MGTNLPRGNWNYPTAVRFGWNRITELPDHCRDLGMKRPLVVTDPGLAGLPMVAELVARNEAAGLSTAVFSAIKANPNGRNVTDGVEAFRAHSADGVIAFGGGSALDAGKAVALMVGQDRPLWDFEDKDDWWTRVKVEGIAPCIAVPTTSGTGSEVGRCSVITDEVEHVKKLIFHPRVQPPRVLCDPALTVGLPAHLTAWTGMDALSHNLEAYCAPGYHPQADGIAMEGIRLVQQSLITAVQRGEDGAARSDMMAASLMGASAFQKGLGGMHAMSHPIGAVLDAQHGLTNAIVMPYVLAFNRSFIEARLARQARMMDLPGHSFDSFLQWVLDLRQTVGIPHTLAAVGVTVDHIPLLARMATEDPSAGGNPRLFDLEAATTLFHMALEGRLEA
jgi:alcohol dehydrogenase class IV